MLVKKKTVCGKFEETHGVRVLIGPKTGSTGRRDAKPELLRKLGCSREEFVPYKSAGISRGDCEKNSVNYQTRQAGPVDNRSSIN